MAVTMAALMALAAGGPIAGQAGGPGADARAAWTSSITSSGGTGQLPVSGPVLREIDDPHNGDRWLLQADPDHPGGPGRLVRISALGMEIGVPGAQQGRSKAVPAPLPESLNLVIRAGDRIQVEASSAVAEVRLEAVALGPAPAGAAFNVRLKIGGRIVRAMALAPGRAAFQPEARP